MNLKLAKRIRRRALAVFADTPWKTLRYADWERHAVRGCIRVSPTCPRGVYLRFKRMVAKTMRRVA